MWLIYNILLARSFLSLFPITLSSYLTFVWSIDFYFDATSETRLFAPSVAVLTHECQISTGTDSMTGLVTADGITPCLSFSVYRWYRSVCLQDAPRAIPVKGVTLAA